MKGKLHMNKSATKLPYSAAVITAIIFGFSFIFTKDALKSLGIFQLLGLRFLTAAIALTIPVLAGIFKIKIKFVDLKHILLVAFFQPILYFSMETVGVNLTSASESGIIISLVTISITIFAYFMLGEHLSIFQWISIFISVSGVILIVLATGSSSGKSSIIGVLALLGAVISAGLYNVLSRKYSTRYTPVEITFVMMWVGAVIFNAIGVSQALFSGNASYYLTALSHISILKDIIYLGVISSVLAFFLLNYSLSKIEASKSAAFMNLTPVVTVLAGVFILGESFKFLQSIGALLILCGIWGVNRKTSI
jgi:drug/metabolite transporter (DMT)-like permease